MKFYSRKMKVNLGMSEEEFCYKSAGQYIEVCRRYLETYDPNYVTAHNYRHIVGIAYGLLRRFTDNAEEVTTITMPPFSLDHKLHIVSNTRLFKHCSGHVSMNVLGYFEDVKEDKK